MSKLQMNGPEITSFLNDVFPELFPVENPAFTIISIKENEAVVCLCADKSHLRPGGTVSGPAMMSLADLAMYVVILAHAGPVALAVTSNLNINFISKPQTGRLFGTARLLKLGRTLSVGDVLITAEAAPDRPVAHATLTYAMPRTSD